MNECIIFPGYGPTYSTNETIPCMFCSQLKKCFKLKTNERIYTDFLFYGVDDSYLLYSLELNKTFKTSAISSCFYQAHGELIKLHPNMKRTNKVRFNGNVESLFNIRRTSELNLIIDNDELFDMLGQIKPNKEELISVETIEQIIFREMKSNKDINYIVNKLTSLFENHFNDLCEKYNIEPKHPLTLQQAIDDIVNNQFEKNKNEFLVCGDIRDTLIEFYNWKPSKQEIIKTMLDTKKWSCKRTHGNNPLMIKLKQSKKLDTNEEKSLDADEEKSLDADEIELIDLNGVNLDEKVCNESKDTIINDLIDLSASSNESMLSNNESEINDKNNDFDELIDAPLMDGVKIQQTLSNEDVILMIHDVVINTFKSYGGNWKIKAFGSKRQDEVLNYIIHKFKDISKSLLEKAFNSILDEMAKE